jgi:hypothetical protein
MDVSRLSLHQFFFDRLPEDKPGAIKRSALVLFLALSMGIFIGINLLLRLYLDKYSPNFGLWLIRQKWEMLINLHESQGVLILGDSTADQGLVAETIQEETGFKTVNLATVASMTFLNDVWMLHAYLQEHDPPKIVLIMNSYQMWHRAANLQAVNTIPFFGVPDRAEVFDPSLGLSDFDHLLQLISHYVPVYSENASLRRLGRSILQIPPDFGLVVEQNYSLSPLGTYSVYEQVPSDVDHDISEHLVVLEGEPMFSPENLAALVELKTISEKYDFDIYLINAPLADEVVQSPDFSRYFGYIESYLQEFSAASEHIHYVPGVGSYNREEMESADHMLRPAAVDFTKRVVRELVNTR